MQKNQRLSLALGLALALGGSQALALGLGSIQVSSGLNQPLVAEIPVISHVPGETDGLRVKLASSEAFARAGLDRGALVPANLEFSLDKNARGETVIKVTTPTRIGEPVLNFLLEVQWARGRMLREYTVLLDPPRVAPAVAPAPAAPATAPVREAPPAAAQPLPPPPRPTATPEPTPASPPPAAPATPPPAAAPPPAPAPSPTPAPEPAPRTAPQPPPPPPPRPTAPAPTADRYGPVASGETLWAIAQRVRPDASVSMNQTMLALQRANPDAFIRNNINLLKRGAVLRIPARDEFAELTAAAAAAEVAEHMRSWRGETALVAQPEAAPRPPTPARPSRPPPTDSRLELLPPGGTTPATEVQSGAAADGGGSELRADLGRAREQVAALQQENRELRSRVTDLERIDRDTKRLIELKDSELAAAQQRLAELQAERDRLQAASDLGSAAPPADEPVSALPPPLDLAADEPSQAPVDEPAEAPVAEPVAVPVTPAAQVTPAAEPRPAATEPLPDRPAPGPAWYNNPLIVGAGLVIAALVAVGFFLARRRREPEPRLARASVADNYAASMAAAPSAAVPTMDDAEADEVERLLDSIASRPDDLDRHLALANHYYRQGDASGFEGAIEAMYAQVEDSNHPSWLAATSMGRKLIPDHPLFQKAPAPTPPTQFATPVPEPPAEPETTSHASSDIEWGLPEPVETPASSADTQSFSVDDLERISRESGPDGGRGERVVAPAVPAPDEAAAEPEQDEHETAEMDRVPAAAESDDEAAATKLELARAYLDMGDAEGARGMLEEVITEGNAGQRDEARRLLDEIR